MTPLMKLKKKLYIEKYRCGLCNEMFCVWGDKELIVRITYTKYLQDHIDKHQKEERERMEKIRKVINKIH